MVKIKTKKKADKDSIEFSKTLNKNFSSVEIASFILTVLGMSEIAHTFIKDKVSNHMQLPTEVKYSMVQHAHFYMFLYKLINGEVDKSKYYLEHLPVSEDSWKSEEDFEARFVFVVKKYYECLKKQGKV